MLDELSELIESDVPANYQPMFRRFVDTKPDADTVATVIDLIKQHRIKAAANIISDKRLITLAVLISQQIKGAYMQFVQVMQSSATMKRVEAALKDGSVDAVLAIVDSEMAKLPGAITDGYSTAGKAIGEDLRIALQGLRPSNVDVTFGAIADKVHDSEIKATSTVYQAQRSADAVKIAEDTIKASKDVTEEALANAEDARKAAERAMKSIRQAQASAGLIKDAQNVTEAVSTATKRAIKAVEDATKAVQRASVSVQSAPGEAQAASQQAAQAIQAAQQAASEAKDAAKAVEDAVRELRPSIGVAFDPTNPIAANESNAMAYDLIREINQEQRDAVRNAVTSALNNGQGPKQAAAAFRDSIGLTTTQQDAVENYRRLLESGSKDALDRALRDKRFDRSAAKASDTPLSQDQIDKMVERYRQRYVAYRADTIARTEATRATSAANHEAFRQTIEEADIDPSEVEKRWNSTHDSRTRLSHVAMDAQRVTGLDTMFTSGLGNKLLYPGDRRAPPQDTVNCRCVVSYGLV